jgi:hypothetical protein
MIPVFLLAENDTAWEPVCEVLSVSPMYCGHGPADPARDLRLPGEPTSGSADLGEQIGAWHAAPFLVDLVLDEGHPERLCHPPAEPCQLLARLGLMAFDGSAGGPGRGQV